MESSQNLHLWKLPAYNLQISWKPRVCPPPKKAGCSHICLESRKRFCPSETNTTWPGLAALDHRSTSAGHLFEGWQGVLGYLEYVDVR